MRITTEHLKFYQHCKTPIPSWVKHIKKTPWNLTPEKPDMINALINNQDQRFAKEIREVYKVSNFLHVLKMVRKNTQSLETYLRTEPFCEPYNQTLARRYLKRIQDTRNTQHPC